MDSKNSKPRVTDELFRPALEDIILFLQKRYDLYCHKVEVARELLPTSGYKIRMIHYREAYEDAFTGVKEIYLNAIGKKLNQKNS